MSGRNLPLDGATQVEYTVQRKHPRKIFSTTVEYAVLGNGGGHVAAATVMGITVNISLGGVCIYTAHALSPGSSIKIMNGTPHELKSTAVVRWAREVSKGLYKAGCEFLEAV